MCLTFLSLACISLNAVPLVCIPLPLLKQQKECGFSTSVVMDLILEAEGELLSAGPPARTVSCESAELNYMIQEVESELETEPEPESKPEPEAKLAPEPEPQRKSYASLRGDDYGAQPVCGCQP